MLRLTIRNGDGLWELAKMDAFGLAEALAKLARYENAEEDGRLIVLPRKPERLNLHRAAELILADEEGRVMIWDAPTETPEPKENGTPREASPADKRRRKK